MNVGTMSAKCVGCKSWMGSNSFMLGQSRCIDCWAKRPNDTIREYRNLLGRLVVSGGSQEGFVYFIQLANRDRYIKIGFRQDPSKRMIDLQVANPYDMVVIGAARGTLLTEQCVHAALSDSKIRGEWFKPDNGVVGLISYLLRESGLSHVRGAA